MESISTIEREKCKWKRYKQIHIIQEMGEENEERSRRRSHLQ